MAETQPRDGKEAHGWCRTAGKNPLQLQHRNTMSHWPYNVCSRVEWWALGCTALMSQPQRSAPSLFPSSHHLPHGLMSSCFSLPFLHLAAPGPAEFQQMMKFNIQAANGQGTSNLAYPWEYEICLRWKHAAEGCSVRGAAIFKGIKHAWGVSPHSIIRASQNQMHLQHS